MLALLLEESGRRRAPCRGFTAQRAEPQRWEPCPHALPARSPNVKRRHVKVSSWHGRSAASPGWAGAPQTLHAFRQGRPRPPPCPQNATAARRRHGRPGWCGGWWRAMGPGGACGVRGCLWGPGPAVTPRGGGTAPVGALRGGCCRCGGSQPGPGGLRCFGVGAGGGLMGNEICLPVKSLLLRLHLLRSHGGGEGGPSASAEDGGGKKKLWLYL